MMPDQHAIHFNPEPFVQDFRLLLPELNDGEVDMLVKSLSNLNIEVIKPPATGLIMVNGRDCFDVDFHLGEVLVTTAEVAVNSFKGHATVLGNAPLKALLAATVAAVIQNQEDEVLVCISPLVHKFRQRLLKKRRLETLLTETTRVTFDPMVKEDEL